MTAHRTSTRTRRLGAAAALAALTVTSTALLTAAPAHAGQYCKVVPHYAPVYEFADPESRIVHRVNAGEWVSASRGGEWEMYRVGPYDYRRVPPVQFSGYMKASNLDCGHAG